MEKIYQKYWDNLREEKQAFWGMNVTTKEIPLIYPVEKDPLIDFLPTEIRSANHIVEEDNYFIFNGKKKVRKIPFLSQLLHKENMPNTEHTSGRMFLTIDPEWILRCSDIRYTSWESCFAPNGCYHFSAKEYTTSINIAMAMITNSDMTKMIGRRFVIIPSRYDNRNTREEIVFFAKHYGTFPIYYQRSLSAYITESVFGSDKNDWNVKADNDATKEEERGVYVEEADNIGNSRFRTDDGKQIWFDESVFVLRKKDATIYSPCISFDSEEQCDNEEPEGVLCYHCEEYVDSDDIFEVFYHGYHRANDVCRSCLGDVAVYDDYMCEYIYLDNAVEYWNVDSNGRTISVEYTDESQIARRLIAIRMVSGIKDGRLCDNCSLYANGVPRSCIEYDGEYLCMDIEDRDSTAITELIEELLEGEDNEDEEEPEEVATEALDE